MIRPLTIASCLLACGSGLYLYQAKHEVQVLDRTIERAVRDTAALREQSRLLAAEWTMLNDPERLRQFSDAYLSLKTIAPAQFTSLADLDGRLPAPHPDAPSHGVDEEESIPVAAGTVPPSGSDPAPGVDPTQAAPVADADEDLPVPPIPVMRRALAGAPGSHSADPRITDRPPVQRAMYSYGQPHPAALADARASDQPAADPRAQDRPPIQRSMLPDRQVHPAAIADGRPFDQRPSEPQAARFADAPSDVRAASTPPPRPIVLVVPRPPLAANGAVTAPPASAPVRPATVTEAAPYGGSLLGMARGSMPPAPRPTPMNASYDSN
jgi:hypothetical protein